MPIFAILSLFYIVILLNVKYSYCGFNLLFSGLPGDAVAKNLPANAEGARDMCILPDPEDSLEKEIATHSSILAWKIPWTE